jgi:predicted TIM-barrel fold metal-dependent hydrolase
METPLLDRLPPGSCDAHLHVFGDVRAYPVSNPNALYQPPQECNLAAMQALHAGMGVDHAVLVQPTCYGTDHRLLVDVLSAEGTRKYRGVAIVDEGVSDAELERLHAAGVRGARFNFSGAFKLTQDLSNFRRSLARIQELGWFAKFFGFGDDLAGMESELRKVKTPAMIDHLGAVDYRRGTGQPTVRLVLDLLREDNWWIGLSNGDLRSTVGAPWPDAVEFGRLFFEAAPDRCVWGSDWPHVHRFIRTEEHVDADVGSVRYELERAGLLARYLPDAESMKRVLVDNAQRLFQFST